MVEILRTKAFDRWLDHLRDQRAKARIAQRVSRLAEGNPGDVKSLGGGLLELRIDYGPGYRVYFTQRGLILVVLLIGGTKKGQDKDIATARELAAKLKE